MGEPMVFKKEITKGRIKMTINECLQSICRFAHDCSTIDDVTPRQLYERSDYDRYCDKITLEDIMNIIKKNENIVSGWITFTSDKRWTPAWGLRYESASIYEVFYIEKRGEVRYSIKFTDKYYACALMVRMEMEQLRTA